MLSSRILNLSPSPTLSLNAKVKELQARGEEIINLTAGEPDFSPPETLRQSALKVIQENTHNHYAPVPGIPALRQAIADKYTRENKINYTAQEIIVGSGAKQVLHNALLALVSPGDEVIIHTPTWSTYVEQIKLAGGACVEVNLEAPFKLTAEKLAEKVTTRTKVVILNYPGNPTGMALDEAELRQIADLIVSNNLWLISDEIYEKILFDDQKHISIASLNPEIKSRTLTVGGLSKSHAVTGWRLGWGAGPKKLIEGMNNLQGQTTSGASSIIQQASLAAFEPDDSVTQMVEAFEKRRDFLVRELGQVLGFKMISPEGAFYLFVDIRELLNDQYPTSAAWCEWLLETAKVSVVPGEAFLALGFFRLSFAASQQDLERAVAGIKGFASKRSREG
jgi:aspartate aminotransferase